MSKRFIIFVIILVTIAILIFFFSEQISQFIQTMWSLNDKQRAKVNDWVGILSGIVGLFALFVTFIRWIAKKDDHKGVNKTGVTFEKKVKIKNGDLVLGKKTVHGSEK